MKKILIIIFALAIGLFALGSINARAAGNVYYVSPTGSDSNIGTYAQPFRSVAKAVTVVAAGDTIYMRGGIYNETATINLTGNGPNGASGNTINLWNYPGEIPIIDFGTRTTGIKGIYFANKSYWHIKGIELRNIKQSSAGEFFVGFMATNVNNCVFENLNIHHLGGPGMDFAGSSTGNLVLNSDFHHNYDSYTHGGNGDGLGFNNSSGTNTVRGSRFWLNSDDGIDAYGAEGKLIIQNNWAFLNGYYLNQNTLVHAGDGNGIKLGQTVQTSTDSYYLVTNNLMFGNWQSGLSQEDAHKSMTIYNNIAYDNVRSCSWGLGYWLNNYNLPHILRNNIAYKNGSSCSSKRDWQTPSDASLIQDHNTWNMSYVVSNSDFLSIDSTGADGPRQSDGSLPNLPFLKLAQGSKLIDAGVDVGLPYNGSYPDLGAYEYTGVIIPTPTSGVPTATNIPTATSTKIPTLTPTKIPTATNTPIVTPTQQCIVVTFNDGTRITVCK
jgi:hypothetical protein